MDSVFDLFDEAVFFYYLSDANKPHEI